MNNHKLIAICTACASAVALSVLDFLHARTENAMPCVSLNLIFTSLCLVLLQHRRPLSSAGDILPVSLSVLCAVSLVDVKGVEMTGYPLKMTMSPPMMVLMMLGEAFSHDMMRFRNVTRLFRNEAVWHNVLDDAKVFYSGVICLALVLYCVSMLAFPDSVACQIVLVSLAAALFLVSVVRVAGGRTLYMHPAKEDELLKTIDGSMRTREFMDDVREKKMQEFYERLRTFFEESKPYLDENLGLDDVARMMLTNKGYLSKTVNIMSGQNFRQFVNYYRVEHAIEIFRRDPRLKVEELSVMSGFHTPVSFNMAFRLFKGENPSEWIRRFRRSVRP